MASVRWILVILAMALSISTAEAVDLVKKASLEIDGKTYEFPISVDKQREMDIYWLRKAINGDKDALNMFLGGLDERLFYIGDEKAAWVRVQSNGNVEVI